jgi:hypothetical protein
MIKVGASLTNLLQDHCPYLSTHKKHYSRRALNYDLVGLRFNNIMPPNNSESMRVSALICVLAIPQHCTPFPG